MPSPPRRFPPLLSTGLADLCPLLREQTSLKRVFLQFQNGFAAGPVEEIRSRVLQSKRRTLCRRKSGLFARLLQVPPCFAQCPYRSSIRQHQASWCLLIRQKPTMATIDVSLDELTGATIIITTTIISRGGSRRISPGCRSCCVEGDTRVPVPMSAFGGKADMDWRCLDVR